MTYGIKIAKPGKSVYSTDMRDLSLDLNTFSMFKLHSSGTTSVTLNAGDSEKSTTISHGLGYVPAFLVYYKRSDESVERLLPDIPYGVDFDFYPWAYATTTGVTVGYSSVDPYNQVICAMTDGYLNSGTNALIGVGNHPSLGSYDCGYRFGVVPIDKNATIVSASVDFYIASKTGSNDVYMKTWGIDEDNVGSFGSDLGKTKTTAEVTQNTGAGTSSYFGINATSIVQEITTRSGWVNGNAMGFYTFNNGTASGSYVLDVIGSLPDTFLKITTGGSITVSFRVIIFKDKIAD